MSYTPGTITGTYHAPDGTPLEAIVEVTPSTVVRDKTGHALIAGPLEVVLDGGVLSVEVPPSSGPDVDPTGVSYTVEVKHPAVPVVRGLTVGPGQTRSASDAVSIDPDPPVYDLPVTRAEFDALLTEDPDNPGLYMIGATT